MESPGFGARRRSVAVSVEGVIVGGGHPIVVQSMTNTDTADADATALQVARLAHCRLGAGPDHGQYRGRAAAVPEIVRKVRGLGAAVPIVGDFHYNGHKLLSTTRRRPGPSPSTASTPATSGRAVITTTTSRPSSGWRSRMASRSGSASTGLARPGGLAELMDANGRRAEPRDARDVMIEAMVESAIRSAELAEATGLAHDRIVLSAKVSGVRDLIDVYRRLAARCDYPSTWV